MTTLIDSTQKMFTSISLFTEKMENQFEHLNDRLTVISNQNKCEPQAGTDSLSLISNEVLSLKTELERKTNVILSKSQTIFDEMKSTSDLVSVTCSSRANHSKWANQTQNQRNSS